MSALLSPHQLSHWPPLHPALLFSAESRPSCLAAFWRVEFRNWQWTADPASARLGTPPRGLGTCPEQGPNSSHRRGARCIALSVACMAVHGAAHPVRRSGGLSQCDSCLPGSASPAVWATCSAWAPSHGINKSVHLPVTAMVWLWALEGRPPSVAEGGMWG